MLSFPPEDADRSWLRSLTVLYVEDDDDTRQLVAEFLGRRAGRVIAAGSGEEGLARFQCDRPSMIVTDIRMGAMNGLEMVREIRCLEASVPVIVTTAFERVEYLETAIDIGVDKFVKKPIDTDVLESALWDCARRLRAEAALAREHERELENVRATQREAMGVLAGGMAHDFNNLLQVVLLSVDEALSVVEPSSDVHEVLTRGMSAVQQAADLGGKLLTLSTGWGMQTRRGPIGPTLREAIAQAAPKGRLDVDIAVAADLPDVHHDTELLGQAFFQILVNAREAMGGSGTLRITVAPRTLAEGEVLSLAEGPYLEVAFRDQGRGIAPEHLPRVFDPYFTTKKRGTARGTGLGLALCSAIVRKHGGLVTAENTATGANFAVLLPLSAPPFSAD